MDVIFLQYGALGGVALILLGLFSLVIRVGLNFGIGTVAGMREDVHAMVQTNEKSNKQFIDFLIQQSRQQTDAWHEVTAAVREVGSTSARGYEQLASAVQGLSSKVQNMPTQQSYRELAHDIEQLKGNVK